MGVREVIWLGIVLAWAPIVFFGIRLRLFCKYRLVFVMIVASMLGVVLTRCLSGIGVSSMTYAWALAVTALVTESLTAAVLLQIYSIPQPITPRKDWHLAVVPLLLASFTLLQSPEIWLFARLGSAAQMIVTYLGLATIVRTAGRKNFRLGWNLKMVLVAITVPSVFGNLVSSSHLTGMLSREVASLWLAGAGLAAWIILAAGMVEHSPPVFLHDAEPNRFGNGFAEKATSTRNLG